jgi:hypothetical protein
MTAARRLALFLLLVGLTFAPGYVDNVDSRIVVRTAESLLEGRAGDVAYDPATCGRPGEYGVVGPDGRFQMKFGIGNAVIAAPFVAAGRAASGAAGLSPARAAEAGASLASALWFAVAGVLVFRLARRHVGERGGVLVATAYALATFALVYGKSAYLETPLTVAVLGAYDAAVSLRERPESRRAAAALGLAVVATLWIKLAGALALVGVVPILWTGGVRRLARGAALAAGIVAVGVAALLWTHHARFGDAFATGYAGSARFDRPLVDGIVALLASARGGLFVYSPLLVLAVPGTAYLARRDGALAAGIWLALAAPLPLYATFFSPFGGDAWGPRYLLPNAALLAVPAGVALHRWFGADAPRRAAAAAVLAFSAAVQAPPALVAFSEYHGLRRTAGESAVADVGPQRLTARVLREKLRGAESEYDLADLGLGAGRHATGVVERGLDVWPERVAREHPSKTAGAWAAWWALVAATTCAFVLLVRRRPEESR